MKFLDNINLNKFREVNFLNKLGNKQDNSDKQQSNPQNIFNQPKKDTFEPSFNRLNDLDTNILNKNLFKYLPEDSLRLEIQLQLAEERKKESENEMKVLSFLGVEKNNEKYQELEQKKLNITKEIQNYRKEYRELGVVYKVIDTVSDVLQKTSEFKLSFTGNPIVKPFAKLIPPLTENARIKRTLTVYKLIVNNMSSKLSNKVTPYGENQKNTNDLVNVMVKAGNFDSQMSKIINSTRNSGSKISDFFNEGYNKTVLLIKNLKNNIVNKIPHNKTEKENFFASSANKINSTNIDV